ncbi:ATP-dependent helicase HrpB [Actinoplanes lutulentus]|uniref:ATP-dependent helicase HrpB n=1 Tax=Actinoplanes lutulentus TaxID=1287878 RepID=A0A327ZDD7_9ACTN|nr:ATP-dependent helicase HrpB [Actinoplanes lutulentus]RAK38406.1 ATP-dependent helicase HrpB [Actinoplanes lutulentus]
MNGTLPVLIPAEALPDLPVRPVLPEVVATLQRAGAAVLVAPPGTGKTTLVPLALASEQNRIIVAEPRRVAARAAARRMASLIGERVGGRVGYAVRGDRQVSKDTVVEVVTTGLLVRRLQHDPELAGTAVVMLDECHERHLDSDLAIAFLAEVRAELRPELQLLATSATADSDRLAAVLGDPAPVLTAHARTYPVEVIWAPPPGPVAPPLGVRVDPRLLDHVAATIRRALTEGDGDILVFLPGAREIDIVAGRLRVDAEVITLHGRQSGSAQDAALRPGQGRRVILSTAIAESSLTVPGVRAVVDAGLSRVPRMDHSRGLGTLATVPVSRASAEQRAGRAGREAPGRVYRCWPQALHDRLPAQPEPEIAAADLTGFALDLALWGHPDGTGLALPDQPPQGALRAATSVLHDLGAIGDDGKVTLRGRALSDAGLHPRLARALLDGSTLVGPRRAAEIIATIDDDRSAGDDVVTLWRRARAANDPPFQAEVRRLTATLTRSSSTTPASNGMADTRIPDDLAAGLIVGLAFPERVAKAREPGGSAYLMVGGTAAELSGGSSLMGAPWLAVAGAERAAGSRTARIRSAAPLDEATAREVAATLLTDATEIGWIDGDVVARQVRRLGAITLTSVRITRPDPELLQEALLTGLRDEGLSLLTWTRTASELRERLAFAHAALGSPWPDVSDSALLASAADWLDLRTARRRADLTKVDVAHGLRRLLPWSVAGRLDEVAPERLPVPSGSNVRVDYADPAAPVLAVKVQEAFGWRSAPRLAEGRIPVLLHLLSPAGRPVAVTRDLASFWVQGYPQVRAELRGRYPRHPWPEDPTTATPTRRLNPRSR